MNPKIVQVKIQDTNASYIVNIPEIEIPRINCIFKNHEYPIMEYRSHSGPMTIIDVGANVGIYAIYAKTLNPDNIVHCFEPCLPTFSLLQTNVNHIHGIYSYPVGLSNFDGNVNINIHPYNTGENSIRFKFKNDTTNTILEDSIMVEIKDAGNEFDRLKIKHIDILKIDTEGCEVDILDSLKHRLCMIDYILIEYHTEEDRRKIDNILLDFHLYHAKTQSPGQGIFGYINKNLLKST